MTRVRPFAALLLIGLLAYCAEPMGDNSNTPGFARIAVRAVAPPSMSRFAPALVVEQVTAVIGHSLREGEAFDTLGSKKSAFSDATNQLDLSLNFPVPGVDTLLLRIEYGTADGTILFISQAQVIVGPNRTTSPPPLVPNYIGPGSNIGFMTMSGNDTVVTAGDSAQLDVTAFDSAQGQVSQFYISWTTDDPRVTVSPRGVIHTPPAVTRRVFVTATTPTGVSTQSGITVQGVEALALSPDSVELRPGQSTSFQVTVDYDISHIWSVGGIDNGDSVHGFIQGGFYTAPATPLPGDETQVCVRNANDATQKGCAKVRVPAIPSVGADIVVINDQNIFDSIPMKRSGNTRFVKNLVNFTTSGPRSAGKTVWYDRGRASPCNTDFGNGAECADGQKGRFNKVLEGQGFKLVKFESLSEITSIPADVKVYLAWMPLVAYTDTEIATLKRFASEGGRIIFIGERADFYTDGVTDGLQIEDAFLRSMGSGMSNLGDDIDCIENKGDPYPVSGPNSLRTNPLTTGVTNLAYACASQITLGPNDIPFFYDISNTLVLGAIAKIDLSPPNRSPVAVAGTMLRRSPIRNGNRRSGMLR